MALANYAELKTAVTDISGRDDIASLMDTFISLCETQMWRTLRVRDMEASADLSLSSGRKYTLPSDFVEARRVRYAQGGTEYPNLGYRSPDSLTVSSGTGTPSQYTITGTLELNRPASGTVSMDYFASLTGLSTANTTNAILTRFPDIYLYGVLAEVFGFSEESQEEAKYRVKFQTSIDAANAQDRKGRHGPSPAPNAKRMTP